MVISLVISKMIWNIVRLENALEGYIGSKSYRKIDKKYKSHELIIENQILFIWIFRFYSYFV